MLIQCLMMRNWRSEVRMVCPKCTTSVMLAFMVVVPHILLAFHRMLCTYASPADVLLGLRLPTCGKLLVGIILLVNLL